MGSPTISFSDSYLNSLNFRDQNISIEKHKDSEPLNRLISSVDNGCSSETESESKSADIKNIALNFLIPEQQNFLRPNCKISFKLIYPNDWPKDYQLINDEDNQKENTISLIGRFKAISHIEGVKGERNLSSKLSDGTWESLADMILECESQCFSSDGQKIIYFGLRPSTNSTNIVQKLLHDKTRQKITPNSLKFYSLFFYVVAFNGQRQIGQTNDIEMRKDRRKNTADKPPRKRIRIESPSSSNVETHQAEPLLNSMLAQINEQINQEPLKTGRFTLILSNAKEQKYFCFRAPQGFAFSLIYPEDWIKKYKIEFVKENTWADQYDTHNKIRVILSCQFKAIYKKKREIAMEKIADLLRPLSDNKFEHLAKIRLERSREENVGNYRLIPINQKLKSKLIEHILNREIPYGNRVANLFFRIIAYHQGQIVDQTNWLEVPSGWKTSSSEILDIPKTSDHPDIIQNKITSTFESVDIKNIKLDFLKHESQNFLASNSKILFKLVYPNDWPKDYQLINDEDNQKENTISLIGRFKAISHTQEVEGECNLSSKLSDGKWESLADMILDKCKSQCFSSDDQKIIYFKLRSRKSYTNIVKELLQERITGNLSRYSLFFYIVAFNGQRQIGQTNDIEMRKRVRLWKKYKRKITTDKPPRKRKRIESPSSSNVETHQAEPPLNSMLAQINEQNLSTQIPMDLIKNETEEQAQMTRKRWEELVQNSLKEIDLIFEKYSKALSKRQENSIHGD